MKKFLVLAFVLVLASAANAALTGIELSVEGATDGPGNVTEIYIPICTNIVIDVYGPAAYNWAGYVIIEEQGGSAGEWLTQDPYPRALPGAGDMSGIIPYTEAGWGTGYQLMAAQSFGDLPGGNEFEMLYHCLGPESLWVKITLWDISQGRVTPQDTVYVHQTPEPMTVALLGLGGLFLLRRRK